MARDLIFSVPTHSGQTCNTHVTFIENEGILNSSDIIEHCKVCKLEGYEFALFQGNKLPDNETLLKSLGFEPKTSKYSNRLSWSKKL
jgi:hypothetical protein